MRFVRKRPWYLASILIGLTAIVFDLTAKPATGRAVLAVAKATGAKIEGAPRDVQESLKQQAAESLHRAEILGSTGFGLAVCFLFCWIGSLWREEPGWQLIPVVVLIAYIMSYLLTV